MSIIKELRENLGFTQVELSKKAGLSLRTIQRLEVNDKVPKGHTLKVLSNVFSIEPLAFQKRFQSVQRNKTADALSIKFINLSVLAFLGIPFGNIILPLLIWRKKRKSILVDEVGKKIINVQILWSILLCLCLSISPFINVITSSSFPLILVVLCIGFLINLIIVIATTIAFQRNNLNFLNPPVRFL